jgi:hypothetical protein
MYDIAERNYEWEEFKYEIPRKYIHPPSPLSKSSTFFGSKKNFLDDLQRQKKQIPGPSHYKRTHLQSRPLSGKMDRSKKLVPSQETKDKQENQPGPGAYFTRPQSATSFKPIPTAKEKALIERPHYLNEVQYLAGHSPGVGAYNLSQRSHVVGPKLLKKVYKDLLKKCDTRKLLNVAASCHGTFEWMNQQAKKKNNSFFGKSKRFDWLARCDKKPAPNAYKFNTNWLSKTCSMNVTSCTSTKSVYYH